MSTNLYWELVKPSRPKTLSTGLKWAIQDKYGSGPVTLTNGEDAAFLEGVRAGAKGDKDTVESCNALLNALDTHEHGVRIWIAE